MATTAVREAVYDWLEDLNSPVDYSALEKRFWAKTDFGVWVQKQDWESCILWEGFANGQGYPIFTIKGALLYAHRVAARLGLEWKGECPEAAYVRLGIVSKDQMFNLEVEPISVPRDMTIDHDRKKGCSTNPLCVYPAHLSVVPRGINAGRKRDLNVFT